MALELAVALPSVPRIALCVCVEAACRLACEVDDDAGDTPDAATLQAKFAGAQPGRHGNVRHWWKYALSKLLPVASAIGRLKSDPDAAAAAAAQACAKALELYHARYPRWLESDVEAAAAAGYAPAPRARRRMFVPSERVLLDDAVTMAAAAATGMPVPTGGGGGGLPSSATTAAVTERSADAGAAAPLASHGATPRVPLPAEDDEEAAAARRAARVVVSRELLAARSVRTGGRGFIRHGDSLEQRKQRLALVLLALEHEDMHSPLSVAGNEYCQGPFYSGKPG